MIEMANPGNGRYTRGVAGDTLNTAWYARHLFPADWSVVYGTWIGTDHVSQDVLAALAVVNTTAAGDSFAAGFLAARART